MNDVIRLALIDDDEAVLDSLALYLVRNGVAPLCFANAEAFLEAHAGGSAFDCIVTDVRMPGMSGLDLVETLRNAPGNPAIILITGHGDVTMAVAAIKSGAFEFLEKPFNEAQLLDKIREAFAATARIRAESSEEMQLRNRIANLPPRQREILELATQGLSSKEIALRLGISPRTVESHRAWLMQRLGVRNLAELVRMAMRARTDRASGASA